MKIARNVAVIGRSDEWHAPVPGSLSEGAGSPQGLTLAPAGAMQASNRRRRLLASRRGSVVRWLIYANDYPPAIINSETFERLRSSKYTPSVSLSLDSSLREGAGNGCTIQPGACETGGLRAIFIAPTKALVSYIPPFIEVHSLSQLR